MEVKLIDYTGHGSDDPARRAAELLVFTKQTRLKMDPGQMDRVKAMTDDEIQKELEYMANTIPSSWEFVDYTFLINGVSRAFTHQFVRTRTGSYAQQTMRILDVNGWDYLTGPTIPDQFQWQHDSDDDTYDKGQAYHGTMEQIAEAYDNLVDAGVAIEDARGLLPTNICTNIVAKFNLRTMAETAHKRASSRTQGEYRDVLDGMLAEVKRVHPWAEMFFNRNFDKAAKDAESTVLKFYEDGRLSDEEKIHFIKLIDQMRQRG